MKGIALPALTEEQQYWVTKILSEVGGLDWSAAKQAAARTPGTVFGSADGEIVIKESL